MNTPIPDTSSWQPREKATETLSRAFYLRCQQVENSILERVKAEIEYNVDNYDSGSGAEDIIRASLSELLPKRYMVTSGCINDCLGRTSGDSEIIIFNDTWFPAVKSGATENSRRRHLPIEGVYATLEVKQTLTEKTLDQAAEKLVSASRLFRPSISDNHITENIIVGNSTHCLANPLFTGIIATNFDSSVNTNDFIVRFVRINQTLLRTEVIRFLCVLGQFSCFWGYIPQKGPMLPASFHGEDLKYNLLPAMVSAETGRCPFYYLVSQLLDHCGRSTLTPEALETAYGLGTHNVQLAMNEELQLIPSNEHIDRLKSRVVPQYIKRKEG